MKYMNNDLVLKTVSQNFLILRRQILKRMFFNDFFFKLNVQSWTWCVFHQPFSFWPVLPPDLDNQSLPTHNFSQKEIINLNFILSYGILFSSLLCAWSVFTFNYIFFVFIISSGVNGNTIPTFTFPRNFTRWKWSWFLLQCLYNQSFHPLNQKSWYYVLFSNYYFLNSLSINTPPIYFLLYIYLFIYLLKSL